MIATGLSCAVMSSGNLYHLLHFIPAVQAWEMPRALERAAQRLVRSGKLRINADAQRNFVRHGTADAEMTFTTRELSDEQLLSLTRAKLSRHVPGGLGPQGVEDLLIRLRGELNKTRGIEPEKEMKVARVVAQSCHPVVLQLLLESGAEVFVSYSHNLGDLMAVHEWQTHGLASGLQSTSETGLQVFISCGGDPFFEGAQKTYTTDGFPALARMVVIGAQELGHFADLTRRGSAITGRYSLSDTARDARRADRTHVAQWRNQSTSRLASLRRTEQSVAFYDKRGKYSPVWLFWQLRRTIAWMIFALRPHPSSMPLYFSTYPHLRGGEALELFLADMAFNLAPDAQVYRRDDPAEEEAIATIESLARVPQQVSKWGHKPVERAWPQLYRFYYGPVMAGCRDAVRGPVPSNNIGLIQQLIISLRRAWRTRPGYYPGKGEKP